MPALQMRSLRHTGPEAAAATSDDDTLTGANGVNDAINGKAGDDWINGRGGADTLTGGIGDDSLFGGSGADRLTGDNGDDFLSGGSGADYLIGGGGVDELRGGSGDDVIQGGKTRDRLTGGGGEDHFVYTIDSDSAGIGFAGAADRITDFVVGEDFLDLSGLDSDLTQAGHQNSWTLEGAAETPGLISVVSIGLTLLVIINLDADAASEMLILLEEVPNGGFSAISDFVI